MGIFYVIRWLIFGGASKSTPSDAKCVTEILGGGDKNKEVRTGTKFS